MICRHCNEKSHYCSSCGSEGYLDEGYCSITCFEKSVITIEKKKSFLSVYNQITEEQKKILYEILADSEFMINRYLDWAKETK